MIANTIGFAFGFGAFLVAFIVLAVAVIRFASRVGRRTAEHDLDQPKRPAGRDVHEDED